MQVKSFITTMGVGIAVGALGALMIPKGSEVGKLANHAASTIKTEAGKMIDNLSSK